MDQEVRPRRADALRNEEKIIEAALMQFSDEGVHAALDGIAKRAGVGAGTLYRHFPTRDHIIASALGSCEVHFQDVRASLIISENSLSALQEWLGVVRDYVRRFDGLAALLLQAANDPSSALSSHCNEMESVTKELLTRAQQSGLARPNIDARVLLVAQLALSCVQGEAMDSTTSPASLDDLLRNGYSVSSSTTTETER